MRWPDQIYERSPIPARDGTYVLTEARWLLATLPIALAFIPLGFWWNGRAYPTQGSFWLLAMGLPLYIVAGFGVRDLFHRRRYTFSPERRTVLVEGFGLSSWRYRRRYRYDQIRVEVRRKLVFSKPIHRRYFAMLCFPDFEVACASSEVELGARTMLREITVALGLAVPEPANTSSPAP